MMLWYKAWIETRARFLIALVGATLLCAYRIYDLNHDAPPWAQLSYFYFALRSTHQLLSVAWLVAVTLLTMGGLLQEKTNGSISFTLGLPVSRGRLMRARIGTALLQAAVLVVVPWAGIYAASYLTGPARSVQQASFYCLILASGGAVFAGAGLLVSSLIEGAYTAPLVSAGVVLLCGNAPKGLAAINPIEFMNGKEYMDASNRVMGAWPWGHVLAHLCIAAVMIWASVRVLERRDL